MYWYFVLAASICAFFGCIVYFKEHNIDIVTITLGQTVLFSAILCLIVVLVLSMIIIPIVFRQFEVGFEFQRQLFEASGNPSPSAELVMLNKELINYQSSKVMFGNWSLLPARVLDIKPIGY